MDFVTLRLKQIESNSFGSSSSSESLALSVVENLRVSHPPLAILSPEFFYIYKTTFRTLSNP
jgi:hypothetical protein